MKNAKHHAAHDAVFDRMKPIGAKPDGLTFPPDCRAELLDLIAARERRYRERLAHRNVVNGKGDAPRRKTAAEEAKRIRAAADALSRLVSGSNSSKVDWAAALRGACIVESHRGDRSKPVLGSQLPPDQWGAEIGRLLACFAELGTLRGEYCKSDPGRENEIPEEELRSFARCLAYHFIRAGGAFGSVYGKAGFPAFLKLVFELIPDGRRPKTADIFANTLSRAITSAEKDEMAKCTPARAGYLIEMTKGY